MDLGVLICIVLMKNRQPEVVVRNKIQKVFLPETFRDILDVASRLKIA